jgi:hypothetical protein
MAVDYRLLGDEHNKDLQGSGDLLSSGLKASTRASRNFISSTGLKSQDNFKPSVFSPIRSDQRCKTPIATYRSKKDEISKALNEKRKSFG